MFPRLPSTLLPNLLPRLLRGLLRRARRWPVTVPAAVSFVLLAVLVLVLLTPGAAWAAPDKPTVKTLPEVIDSVTAWIVGIAAAYATYCGTVGGIRMMSAKDPTDGERAKTSLRNAGLGFGVVVLAPVLVALAQSLLFR